MPSSEARNRRVRARAYLQPQLPGTLVEGWEEGASLLVPQIPLTAMGSKFRQELEKTQVRIPPASCHVPLPGKETGVLEKRKQTQKASWASNSS